MSVLTLNLKMFATDLIKMPAVRDFLISKFPKPSLPLSKERKVYNPNPSLTGNTAELFFRLLIAKKKPTKEFEAELKHAQRMVELLKINHSTPSKFQDSCIGLNRKDYNRIVPELTERLLNLSGKIKKISQPVRLVEVKVIGADLFKIMAIIKDAFGSICWDYHYTFYDSDAAVLYYEKQIQNFPSLAEDFLQNRIVTKQFIRSMIVVNHLNSIRAGLSGPLIAINLETQYLTSLQAHFQKLGTNHPCPKGKVVVKPSLSCYDVLARPDFLIGKTIWELKTSQRILSQNDYLQALLYLLLAQHPSNVKTYGQIDQVVLYYTLHSKHVDINLKDFNFKKQIVTGFSEILKS